MKKIGVLCMACVSVFLTVAPMLSSCADDISEQGDRYVYVDTSELSVGVSSSRRYSQRAGYELEIVRETVSFEEDPEFAEKLNDLTEKWISEGELLCDKLRGRLEAAHGSTGSFSVGCYVTYNSSGVVSLVGRISCTEFGETNFYVFESSVWDIGAKRVISASDILSISSTDYENWLTLSFYPIVSKLSAYFPQKIVDASGVFSEVVDYYLEPGKAKFYFKYEDIDFSVGYASVELDFSENPHMFRYRIDDLY